MMIKIERASLPGPLTRIARRAKGYWGYPPEWMALWKDDLALTRDWVESHTVYQAVLDQDVIGFYALSGSGPKRELEHFWVEPDYIGEGIGRKLFTHAVHVLRKDGARFLKIVSDPNAEPFYVKMGARRVGESASLPAGRRLPVLVFRLDRDPSPALSDRP